MAFYTASTYSEATNGDFVYGAVFGPIFGTGTTITGTASNSDRDSFYYDISGTGLEDTDHPRTLPKGSTQPISLTVSGSGTYFFTVGDSQANPLYTRVLELTSTPVTISGSFVVTNSSSNYRTYVYIETFNSAPSNLSYTLNIGTTTTPTPTPVNRPPVAVDDAVSGIWGEPIVINALFNDRDPDGDRLSTVVSAGPQNGSVVLNANNTFTYKPNDGFVGADSFDYVISDGRGGTATAKVRMEVLAGDRVIDIGVLGGAGIPTLPPIIPGNSTLTYKFRVDSPLTLFSDYYGAGTPRLFASPNNIAPTLEHGVDSYSTIGDVGSNPRPYNAPLMPGNYSFQFSSDGAAPNQVRLDDRIVPDGAGNASYWSRSLGTPQAAPTATATDFVSRIDDVDYYSFTTTVPSAVIVTVIAKDFTTPLSNPINSATRFSTYRLADALFDVHTTATQATPLPAATYKFGVFGSQSDIAAFGDRDQYYQVYVSAWADNVGNTAATATDLGALNGSIQRTESVGIADPNDYYRFTLSSQTVIRASLTDENGMNVLLGILDANGLPIVTDFGQGGGNTRQITLTLDAGTYLVRAYMPDYYAFWFGSYGNGFAYPYGGASGYTLSLQGNVVPAGQAPNLDGGANGDTIFGRNGGEVINGNAGNDTIYGRGGPDLLQGGEGSDFLYGDEGNDSLRGGAGNDQLSGGAGADYLDGGDGFNYASYVEAPAGVYASLLNPAANTGHAAGDTYFAIQGLIGTQFADVLVGNGVANVLTGGEGDDVLYGFGGADELNGDGGTDQLYGGDGGDRLDGGAGFDYARYDFSPAGVVVRLDYGQSSGGDAAGDTFISIEGVVGSSAPDTLIGDGEGNILHGLAGNDWLYGQSGEDQLYGGPGSDQIIGGSGSDYLSGGAGNDQFYFLRTEFSPGTWDRIIDFGESGANFDYLRFEAFDPAELIFAQNGANAVITTTSLNFTGGIIIENFNAISLADQMIFT